MNPDSSFSSVFPMQNCLLGFPSTSVLYAGYLPQFYKYISLFWPSLAFSFSSISSQLVYTPGSSPYIYTMKLVTRPKSSRYRSPLTWQQKQLAGAFTQTCAFGLSLSTNLLSHYLAFSVSLSKGHFQSTTQCGLIRLIICLALSATVAGSFFSNSPQFCSVPKRRAQTCLNEQLIQLWYVPWFIQTKRASFKPMGYVKVPQRILV